MRDRARRAHADVFGVRAGADAEDAVARAELAHGGAGLLHFARKLEPHVAVPGPEEADEEAADEVLHAAAARVAPGGRRRVDANEHLVLLRLGPIDLFDAQDLGWPVPLESHCSHWLPLLLIGAPCLHMRPAR